MLQHVFFQDINISMFSNLWVFFNVSASRYGILLAMHAYGLGGKPLGSVAKFTELCREVLGEEAMPQDEHLVCGSSDGCWALNGNAGKGQVVEGCRWILYICRHLIISYIF